jgi:hypothetical protein
MGYSSGEFQGSHAPPMKISTAIRPAPEFVRLSGAQCLDSSKMRKNPGQDIEITRVADIRDKGPEVYSL